MFYAERKLLADASPAQIEHGIVDRNSGQGGNYGGQLAATGLYDQHKHCDNDNEGDDIGKYDGFHAHRCRGAHQNSVAYGETGSGGNNIDKFLLALMSRAATLGHTGFTS